MERDSEPLEQLVKNAQGVKEEGNRHFAQNEFEESIQLYTNAINYFVNYFNPRIQEIKEEDELKVENNATETPTKPQEFNPKQREIPENKETLSQTTKENQENGEKSSESGTSKRQLPKLSEEYANIPSKYYQYLSVYLCNRAASHFALKRYSETIEDTTSAIIMDPKYTKAYIRRAKAYEETNKFQEALNDYETILEIDGIVKVALEAKKTLPSKVKEQQEKEKAEMMTKLKELGN